MVGSKQELDTVCAYHTVYAVIWIHAFWL